MNKLVLNKKDQVICPVCGSANIVIRAGMFANKLNCLNCKYEQSI